MQKIWGTNCLSVKPVNQQQLKEKSKFDFPFKFPSHRRIKGKERKCSLFIISSRIQLKASFQPGRAPHVIVTESSTVPGWNLNPGPLSQEENACLTVLTILKHFDIYIILLSTHSAEQCPPQSPFHIAKYMYVLFQL